MNARLKHVAHNFHLLINKDVEYNIRPVNYRMSVGHGQTLNWSFLILVHNSFGYMMYVMPIWQ